MGSKHEPQQCEICSNEFDRLATVGNNECVIAHAVNQWEALWTNVQICNGCKWDNKHFKKPEGWPRE